uniref:Uncharacterized protein n=1 Tax=Arundo donax TaxID=35708 RepID=A0A0A9G8Z1_ARUDO
MYPAAPVTHTLCPFPGCTAAAAGATPAPAEATSTTVILLTGDY